MEKVMEKFIEMVRNHDLTYMYSDDPRWYHAGSRSLSEIRSVADILPREDVVRIWNAEVDRKLLEGHREQFYWKV